MSARPTYAEFLRAKAQLATSRGFVIDEATIGVHPALKPHQADIVRWAVHKGRAAVFAAFACRHIILTDRAIETQAFCERCDDMVANALGTTCVDELSANCIPIALEALALDVIEQAQSGQVRMQIEPHERFWQCRTEERAVMQIKRHARDDGTSMSKPSGRRAGGCIVLRAICSLPRC